MDDGWGVWCLVDGRLGCVVGGLMDADGLCGGWEMDAAGCLARLGALGMGYDPPPACR